MKFLYEAKNQQDNSQRGEIRAKDKQSALDVLKTANLTVISLIAQSEVPIFAKQLKIFDRISFKDIAIFTRQLAVLVGSQVPLVSSLRSLLEQTKKKFFQEIIFNVAADVEGGMPLSDALAKNPKIFSNLYVSMIKTGETSGTLNKSLLYLAEHLEQEYDMRSKIKSAMIYPAFILLAYIAVIILMLVFVFPRITLILGDTGQELPIITRVLIDFTGLFRIYWWIGVIALLISGIGLWYYRKTLDGKKTFDYLKIRLPIFGPLFKKIYMSRFAGNLATLISGGIPIINSLQIVSQVVSNQIYEKIILEASERVKVGEQIAAVFENNKYMPVMVSQMIKVGEQTGQLDIVLESLSKFYTREVNNALDGLTELIQPVLIVSMGIMVGFLVLSILMPIYNMVTAF
ncbi:MAG: type II secretion system F family protein [bacterium]